MADKTEFLQAIDDAILDADSLERFINGSDSETVLTRLSAEYPTLQKALKELFGNGGIAARFKTLADLQASPLVDGAYALVADDTNVKNGIYIKEGGVWVKSKYDAAVQAFNMVQGVKDNLFKGRTISGTLSYVNDAEAIMTLVNNRITAIANIEGGKKYRISKGKSDRFVVFASAIDVASELTGDTTSAYVDGRFITPNGISHDSDTLDFDALEGERYLYIVVSISNQMPDYLSVLEIGSVARSDKNNANYLEIGIDNVYTSRRASKKPAHDDTEDLQAIFNAGGAVELDGNAIYNVSNTVTIDMTKVKSVNGNGATIVSRHGGVALKVQGGHTTSAGPRGKTHQNLWGSARCVKNLRITSASGFSGTGVSITNTFKLDIDVQVYFMQTGIVVEGLNRNLRLKPNVYQMTGDGLVFAKNSNLHQGQIHKSDISYTFRAIVFDDAELYNLQFLGGDIESSYIRSIDDAPDLPVSEMSQPSSIIYMKAQNNTIQDITFYNLTIEDHHTTTDGLVVMESTQDKARFIRFVDCFYGNTPSNNFTISGVHGLNITGMAEHGWRGAFVQITGSCTNVDIRVTSTDAGVVLLADGDFTLTNTRLRAVSNSINKSLVYADCNIKNFMLDGNVASFNALKVDQPLVKLGGVGRTVDLANVSNNIFDMSIAVNSIVSIEGTVNNCMVQGNIATHTGAYPTDSEQITSANNKAG